MSVTFCSNGNRRCPCDAVEECPDCLGTGQQRPRANMVGVGARALLAALGLASEMLVGEVSVPVARRAIIRARNRRSLEPFTRPSEIVPGATRILPEGAIEVLPAKSFNVGVDEFRLRRYLAEFEILVRESERIGATRIMWS